MSPERLWLLSIALRKRGLMRLAKAVKKVNSALYHNSLPVSAEVSPDISFGHHGFGTIVHGNVVIGKRVKIWHHVTLAVRGASNSPARLIIEDDVRIGANSVVITPLEEGLRIGRGARIGAGAVVTTDVPPGATVISQPARVLMDQSASRLNRLAEAADPGLSEVEALERAQEGVTDDHVDA
jgi:serine O-acetyltransferase